MIKYNPIKLFVLLLLFVLFSSCLTTRQLSMEVLSPAEIVIPASGKRVTIVDNSHALDSANGHGIYIKRSGAYVGGDKNYSYDKDPSVVLSHKETVNVDSVSASVVKNLSNRLLEANFFEAVTLWNENVRQNSYQTKGAPLRRRDLTAIAEASDADIVISLDALSENDVLLVREIYDGWYDFPTMDVYTQSFWRIYDINNDKLLSKIVHKDTVFWEGRLMYNFKVIDIPHLEDAILEAGWNHGHEVSQKIVPSWGSVMRTYYTGGASGLSQSATFVKMLRWEEMAAYFEGLLLEAKKEKQKALYAFNIAVAYELQGDLIKANDYVRKALEFSKVLSNKPTNVAILENSKRYWKVLRKRQADDKLIQRQMSGDQ